MINPSNYQTVYNPIIFNSNQDDVVKCPKCGNIELEYHCTECKHNFEIEESEISFSYFILAFIVACLLCWFLLTLATWFTGDDSLLNTLKDQYNWVKNLKIW